MASASTNWLETLGRLLQEDNVAAPGECQLAVW